MILAQNLDQRKYWAAAFSLSAVAHTIVFIAVFDLWPSWNTTTATPFDMPDISVSSVMMEYSENLIIDNQTVNPEPSAETPENLQAQILTAAPHKPEKLPVVEPDPADTLEPEIIQSIAQLEITRLSPIRSDDEKTLLGLPPLTLTPERLTAIPIGPEETSTMASVTLSPLSALAATQNSAPNYVPPAPSPEDSVMNQLVQKIRDRLGDPCLVAFPQRNSTGDPLVLVISNDDRVINTFADAVLKDMGAPIEHRTILVDSRQCPALNMVRENKNYPSFGLSVKLRSPIIKNGGALVGTISNIAGMYTSLLLVDDNGVVQDLRRFTSFAAGRAEFDIPMTRSDAARDTKQILLVVATRTRPKTITQRAGHLAENFFPDLKAELGAAEMLALVTFEVR